VGPKPPWLAAEVPLGVALVGDPSKADVVHAAADPRTLARLRRELPPTCALVLQLGSGTRLGHRDARRLQLADLILMDSAEELHQLKSAAPLLSDRARLLPQPVDLEWHAPEKVLLETPRRGRDLRRFRRFHRMAPPVILFAGPYTHAGGLDLALDAIIAVRATFPETRLAAIPIGKVDTGYRDAIERRALALGHHGIIEWAVPDDEVPFWYACADIVCAPSRTPITHAAATHAAAAGRPFVGSEFEILRPYLGNGQTGYVVPPEDPATLTAALAALTGDQDEARRLGEQGRRWAERTLSPAATLARLTQLWQEASRTLAAPTRSVRRPIGFATR
jgi:glycosyltransferase involved in cell wall biosynthesis